jgi:hypothetical protein
MPFNSPVDIANRALQHVGARRILTLADNTKTAAEIAFCFDKLRRAELRRAPWRFASRRAVLRPWTTTMRRVLPPLWSNVTPYSAGQIVVDTNGIYWNCMISHTGQTPGTPRTDGGPPYWQQYFGPIFADLWSSGNTYNAGEVVYKTGPAVYVAVWNGLTSDPASDPGNWILQVGSPTLVQVVAAQPFGPNLTINTRARNAFPLPYGYMRALPPDPKVESREVHVTTAGLRYTDWQLEGNFIVSQEPTSLLLRFVADVQDVSIMDDLFCEMLSARIGYEICESLTQSATKLDRIGSAYQKFADEARLVNWLETGDTELQEEAYEQMQSLQEGVAKPNERQGA